MKPYRVQFFAAALFAASLVVASATATRADDELLREDTSGIQYLEMATGAAAPGDPLPIVVAIHGLGDNPASFRLLLDDIPAKARLVVPRGPMPQGIDGFTWFALHTDDEEGERQRAEGIRNAADRLATFISALVLKYGGPSRVVVCGFSQGGMLSFALASMHPELVAAAIPISGYLPASLWPAERPNLKPLPKVFALHGESDRLVPVQGAKWTVEALRSNGFDSTLRTWPGVGHSLSHDMRVALIESVIRAVEELAPAGSVMQGPPRPHAYDSKSPLALPPGAPDAFDVPAVPSDASEPAAPASPAAPAADSDAPDPLAVQ